jgi:hypothetical protein
LKALTKLFGAAVGTTTPELGGLAGVFVKKLVTAYAERIFQSAADGWLGKSGDSGAPGRDAAAWAEASLPSATAAKRLLVPGIAERRATDEFHLETEMARQVRAVTMDERRMVLDRLTSRERTLDDQLRLVTREAQQRGMTVDELKRERQERIEMQGRIRAGRKGR